MGADLNCLRLVREEVNFELTICDSRWGRMEGEVGHVDLASQRVLTINPTSMFDNL